MFGDMVDTWWVIPWADANQSRVYIGDKNRPATGPPAWWVAGPPGSPVRLWLGGRGARERRFRLCLARAGRARPGHSQAAEVPRETVGGWGYSGWPGRLTLRRREGVRGYSGRASDQKPVGSGPDREKCAGGAVRF